MKRKILINYANEAFKKAQKLNSKTGIEIGGFDRVIEYSPKDIDKKFYEKNKHILDQMRLGGYALWKPYIILKTLMRKDIKKGDYIFYCDSGSYFINKIDYLVDLSIKYNQDIIPFGTKDERYLDKYWSKKDAFILMGCDSKAYTDTPGKGAGISLLIKKSEKSLKFIREFLEFAQDERIITDIPSELDKEYLGFKENRHDQTILSLLVKKNSLKTFRLPHQRGNREKNLFEDKYPQIIVSTRRNNRTIIQKIKYQKACSKNTFVFFKKIFLMPLFKIINKLRGVK